MIIQSALLMHAYHIVNYASYCAVRAGIVHNGEMEIMRKAADIASAPVAGEDAITEVDVEKGDGELTATVTHYYKLIVPVVNTLLKTFSGEVRDTSRRFGGRPHIPIRASSTLPMEH